MYNTHVEEREYILIAVFMEPKFDSALWPNLGYSSFSSLIFKPVQKIRGQKSPYSDSKEIDNSNSGRIQKKTNKIYIRRVICLESRWKRKKEKVSLWRSYVSLAEFGFLNSRQDWTEHKWEHLPIIMLFQQC